MGSLALTVTKTAAGHTFDSSVYADYALWFRTEGNTVPEITKSGGGSTISAAIYGTGTPTYYSGDPRTLSWTGGTPTASGSSDEGTYNPDGIGTGFTVTLPATTSSRTARLFCGYYNGDAKITVSLSDSSASPLTDSTTLTDSGGSNDGFVEVVYSADSSSGVTLQIRIEVLSGSGGPNATINGAGWFAGGSTPATITAVSDSTPQPGDSITLTVTGAGATQGAGGVTLGGEAQAVTWWSDTSITVTVGLGGLKYGTQPYVVTADGASPSASFNVTLTPPTGWAAVDITTPAADPSTRIRSVPDIASGDQAVYDTVGGLVSIDSSGVVSADPSVYSFQYAIWSSGSGWSATFTQVLYKATPVGAMRARQVLGTFDKLQRAKKQALDAKAWGTGPSIDTARWFAPELGQAPAAPTASTAARGGARASVVTSKGSATTVDGRDGPRGAVSTAPADGTVITARAGARSDVATLKGAGTAVEARAGAIAADSTAKAAASQADARAAARADNSTVPAVGAIATATARAGARAAVTTVKGAATACGSANGALASAASSKAAAAVASASAAARGAATTVHVDGLVATSIARAGVRASVATVKATTAQASARAAAAGQVASAKTAATFAIARAAARAAVSAGQFLPLAGTRIYVLPPENRVWDVPAVNTIWTIE